MARKCAFSGVAMKVYFDFLGFFSDDGCQLHIIVHHVLGDAVVDTRDVMAVSPWIAVSQVPIIVCFMRHKKVMAFYGITTS